MIPSNKLCQALTTADWSGVSIGNKALILSAITQIAHFGQALAEIRALPAGSCNAASSIADAALCADVTAHTDTLMKGRAKARTAAEEDAASHPTGLTVACTWEEFKRMGKEFLDLLPCSTEDQAEAGYKALGLAYIGLDGTDMEVHQAAMLLRILGRKKIEHDVQTTALAKRV